MTEFYNQTIAQNSFETDLELAKFEKGGSVYWVLLPHSAQISPTPDPDERSGSNSVKFTLKESDWDVTNRSEIGLKSVAADSEYVYSFSTFLPESYTADPTPEILAQWHAKPDFDLGETWSKAGPVLSLNVADGKWLIDSRWDSRQIMQPQANKGKKAVPEGSTSMDLGNYQTGEWTDWIFRVKWSLGDDGLIEVWQDGELVMSQTGPNRYNDLLGPYFRMGIYKPAGWDEAEVSQREAFYDDLSVFPVTEADSLLIEGGQEPLLSGGIDDNIYILDTTTASGKQIRDLGGRDTLVFKDLTVGLENFQHQNGNLLLDIDRNRIFDLSQDLVITDFFAASGVGDGFIETIGNLEGSSIFDAFAQTAISTATASDNI